MAKSVRPDDLGYPLGAGEIDIYRVQQRWAKRRGGFWVLVARRPWSRTWQAEWPGCKRAPRAFTRRGVLLKALRAFKSATSQETDAGGNDG